MITFEAVDFLNDFLRDSVELILGVGTDAGADGGVGRGHLGFLADVARRGRRYRWRFHNGESGDYLRGALLAGDGVVGPGGFGFGLGFVADDSFLGFGAAGEVAG